MYRLTRRDPWREMLSLRSNMDRLFDNFLYDSSSDFQQNAWDMALDVSENDDEYVVKATVPGIKPEDLDITYTGNTLTIKGETRAEETREDERYHLRERRFGSFQRTIALPSTVDADNIQAKCEDGVLTLQLPKAEEAKPRRVSVQADESPRMIEGRATDIKTQN